MASPPPNAPDQSGPRHARNRPGRYRVVAAIAAVALVLAFVSAAALRQRADANNDSTAANKANAADSAAVAASRASSKAAAAGSASAASASAAGVAAASASASAAHDAAVQALVGLGSAYSAGSISLAALNVTTGATYSWGATSGMTTGSIVKLYILETLLLQRQNSGRLTSSQQATAVKMIENSDNGAAETLFEAVGGRTALIAANSALGLKSTTPGPGDYWGLTVTSATDYISLLNNLIAPTGSPLTATSQAYVLGLMRSVESDQRWGVGVTADAGTDFANKNGWLGVDTDGGRWLVNSTGVVTIHGQPVLMVVLTQHDSDFQTGVNLVQSLAQALAPVIAP